MGPPGLPVKIRASSLRTCLVFILQSAACRLAISRSLRAQQVERVDYTSGLRSTDAILLGDYSMPALARAAASASNFYAGGILPVDFLDLLASFFSNNYLRSLACVCRRLRRSAINPVHWQDKRLSLDHEELMDAPVLRSLAFAFSKASVVTVNASLLFRGIPLAECFFLFDDVCVACCLVCCCHWLKIHSYVVFRFGSLPFFMIIRCACSWIGMPLPIAVRAGIPCWQFSYPLGL